MTQIPGFQVSTHTSTKPLVPSVGTAVRDGGRRSPVPQPPVIFSEPAPLAEGAVPVWHPDVKVWEVTDRSSGAHVGLWYLDPFAHPGKRSGAWATSFRSHETYAGQRTPLVSNNSNFVKGETNKPTLISWDDAETFFHEFGHALHGLSSNVAYPTLNNGVRDYTEFQSQLLEHWLMTDEVIENYLVHYESGGPMC